MRKYYGGYAGHSRFIWNYFWHLNLRRLHKRRSIMRYAEMDYWSKFLKKSEQYQFLSEAPAHIIQQKRKDLDKAYQDGFDKTQPNKRLPKKEKSTYTAHFDFLNPSNLKLKTKEFVCQK